MYMCTDRLAGWLLTCVSAYLDGSVVVPCTVFDKWRSFLAAVGLLYVVSGLFTRMLAGYGSRGRGCRRSISPLRDRSYMVNAENDGF